MIPKILPRQTAVVWACLTVWMTLLVAWSLGSLPLWGFLTGWWVLACIVVLAIKRGAVWGVDA